MSEMQYSMKAVASATGLSPHVIRIWEKRYGAVTPDRSETNRRRYSEAEVARLRLLKAATTAGHNIGQIARSDDEQLRRLVGAELPETGALETEEPLSPQRFVSRGMQALRQLDAAGLDQTLSEAAVSLGTQGLLQKVVVPLTYRIGELWQSGDLTAGQEHFASSLIRNFLGNHTRPFVSSETASVLVVATPLGQLHELGAVIVTAAAANLGWRVINLGASLPAAEIAAAAVRGRARAVALSIVFPADDPMLPEELRGLRRMLPAEQRILAGGRAAPGYQTVLREINATVCTSLEDFQDALLQIGQAAAAT